MLVEAIVGFVAAPMRTTTENDEENAQGRTPPGTPWERKKEVMDAIFKKVWETWLSPFFAGTAAGMLMFWM